MDIFIAIALTILLLLSTLNYLTLAFIFNFIKAKLVVSPVSLSMEPENKQEEEQKGLYL